MPVIVATPGSLMEIRDLRIRKSKDSKYGSSLEDRNRTGENCNNYYVVRRLLVSLIGHFYTCHRTLLTLIRSSDL